MTASSARDPGPQLVTDNAKKLAGLIAGFGGAFLGIFYVLLNSSYVRFYEGLGVRPEDVGFDRASVLARTTGLAIVMLFTVAVFASSLYGLARIRRRRGKISLHTTRIKNLVRWIILSSPIALGMALWIFAATRPDFSLLLQVTVWYGALLFGLALALLLTAYDMPGLRPGRIALALLAICYTLITMLSSAALLVDHRIQLAQEGEPVLPITFEGYPLIDIHAPFVHADIVNESTNVPLELQDPKLLYVGQGAAGTTFIACGHAVTVHTGRDVQFTIERGLNTITTSLSNKEFDSLRKKFCDCLDENNENQAKKYAAEIRTAKQTGNVGQ